MSTEPRRVPKSSEPKNSALTNPARAAMQRSRRPVPGGAVGRAGAGVRGAATRVGRVASSTTASGRSAAGGLTTTAGTATGAAAGTATGAVTTVAGKVANPLLSGAAFALVVRKVMVAIRFLRQLALQLLEALKQLAVRLQELTAHYRGGEREESGESPEERPEPAPPDAPPVERRRAPAPRRPERPGGPR